jgi:hypothetical protein
MAGFSRAEAVQQNDLALVGAAGIVAQVLRVLGVAVEGVEAVEMLKLLHQGTLDLGLGDEVRHG